MNLASDAQAKSPLSSRSGVIWIYLLLGALVLGVYAYVAQCDFINLDDFGYIHANPLVKDGLSWSNVIGAFQSFMSSLWAPLTWISFMIDVSLFGLNPAAFHLENVLWHVATTLLLFHGLSKATRRLWPSAIVAALFGLHPINIESVAWVTERKNVLCAFFSVLTINAYLSYARRPRRGMYALSVVCHALALMAKPMAVVLPGMLLLLDLWPANRDVRQWRRLLVEKLPFILLSAASCALTLRAPFKNDAWVTADTLPLASRISNALVSYGAYLRDLAWPAHLSAYYPHPIHTQPLLAGLSALVLVAITIVALRKFRSAPYLLVGWLWFLGALVPMIGLVQVGSVARADRFTYLAQIGIFFAVVWWIADHVPKHRRALAGAIAGLTIAGFAAQTVSEVQYWTNSVTLFERAIEQTGPNACARVMAGRGRASQGDLPKAAEHFKIAVMIQPHLTMVWYDLGNVLMKLGNYDHAVQSFAVAARQQPQNDEYRAALAGARQALAAKRRAANPES